MTLHRLDGGVIRVLTNLHSPNVLGERLMCLNTVCGAGYPRQTKCFSLDFNTRSTLGPILKVLALYPSGKGAACKAVNRQFDPDKSLHDGLNG